MLRAVKLGAMKTLTCAAATILWCACFPGAIDPAADATTTVTDAATEVADTNPTTTPDTEVADSTAPPDTTDTTTTTEVVDTSVEVDVPPECDDDNDCTGLTVAPCVVGRCTNQRCVATNLTVACDDRDPCTTADACSSGACSGRAFTTDEAASWVIHAGGEGAEAVTDTATYDEDEVVVVGAFQATMDLPSGFSLTSNGKVDAFVVRVTDRGQITRAFALGSADTDEGATLVAVSPTKQVIVALHAVDASGIERSAAIEWIFDNGNVMRSVPVPGFVTAMTAFGEEDVIITTIITSSVSITLRDGGSVTLDPNSTRAAAVMRVSVDGVVWAKAVVGPGRSYPISVTSVATDHVWFSAEVEEQTAFGGVQVLGPDAPTSGYAARLDATGTVVDSELSEGSPVILARSGASLVATRIVGGFEDAEETRIEQVDADLAPRCAVTLTNDVETGAATGATGLGEPSSGGDLLFHGEVFGPYDFGGGVVSTVSAAHGVYVHFDMDCQPTGLWLSELAPTDNGPEELRFAMSDFNAYYSQPAFTVRGGLVIGSYAKLAIAPGSAFEDQILVPDGSSDAVIAGISKATLWSCTLAD